MQQTANPEETHRQGKKAPGSRIYMLAVLLGLVALMFFAVSFYMQTYKQHTQGMGQFEQAQQAYANLGGDFAMDTTTGETSLSGIWKNKIVLLYFGFTRCPDICPTSLATMQAALGQLPPAEREQLQVVLVSADPEYDTVDRLHTYVTFFIADGIGMTSSVQKTQKAAEQYGAYFRKVDLPDSALGYTVDHTTRWYLIQKNGKIGTVFDHDLAPQDIANTLGIFARDAL